jgi:hypothetical protein
MQQTEMLRSFKSQISCCHWRMRSPHSIMPHDSSDRKEVSWRHSMRQVTREDFPPSWQAGETEPQSHDSRYYGACFLMRLDAHMRERLEELSRRFDHSVVVVIRQLVTQATIEDFLANWQMAVDERR